MFHRPVQQGNANHTPAAHQAVPARLPVQRVGGMDNELAKNYCFMNAVIQVVQHAYADLFNPVTNILPLARQPLQARIWQIIQDLGNQDIALKRVSELRGELQKLKLVASLTAQEDAQELMAKLIDYVSAGSSSGGYRMQQLISSSSEESDVVGDVPIAKQNKEPSNIKETTQEIGSGMIGVDINIYQSFEDFLYYLYGVGTNTELDSANYLQMTTGSKHVYVKARKERREFTLLPPVVTFYIKRFFGGMKNVRDFPMPDSLFLVEQPVGKAKRYKKYVLEAYVRHSGSNSIAGGHYYALKKSKAKEGGWVTHNDAVVGPSDNEGANRLQGSLYTYRLVEEKEGLGFGEVAYQESKPFLSTPPKTTGITSIPFAWNKTPGTGVKPSTKGGGFSPFIGTTPVGSDKIRGLPNRSRQTPEGTSVVVDCFINATLQLIAGGYRELFDPVKNPLKDEGRAAVQKSIHALIGKINQSDTEAIAEDAIETLRVLLVAQKAVGSLLRQEDATELMRVLVDMMVDVPDRKWTVPGKGVGSAASIGRLAAAGGVSIEAVLRANPWLGRHYIGISSQRRYHTNKIAGGRPSHVASSTLTTPMREEAEPQQGLIEVDIGQIGNFEEFLYSRYGKGMETETFDKDYPRANVHTSGGAQAYAFTERQKRYQFNYLPPVLSFYIKRFKQEGPAGKDSRNYLLPHNLILVEVSQNGKKTYKHYDLKAVVVHTGDSLDEGHYYTHRKEGEDWTKADDRSVWHEASPGADMAKGVVYNYALIGQSDGLGAGQQAPQEKYDLPATVYRVDGMLRPTDAMGYASDPKHRISQSQADVSGELNTTLENFFKGVKGNFHAGHLFTSTLGGVGDARNLAPVWGAYNTGGYKTFEDVILTKLLEQATLESKKLYIHIHAEYPADNTPESVFQHLLNSEDIQYLATAYNTDVSKMKEGPERQRILGVKNYYPYLIRMFRRIPMALTNPETRIVGFKGPEAIGRGANLGSKIGGSPRNYVGRLIRENFTDAEDDAAVPHIYLYGPGTPTDLKGQDPDEWAVKTYKQMPEPGIYAYYNDAGRASGVDAYIWMDPEGIYSAYHLGGGTEDAGPSPAGFRFSLLKRATITGREKASLYKRGHLLNGRIHGSGNDPQNLTPLTQQANSAMDRYFEEMVKKEPDLVTVGKGIFWKSRMEGNLTRPDYYNKHILKLQHKSKRSEIEEAAIELSKEEARMFARIHLFAYEAIVKDGKANPGRLLHSGSFANTFTAEGTELGATGYQTLLTKDRWDRMQSLANLREISGMDLKTELDAVTYVDRAIDEQDKMAGENFRKPSPEAVPQTGFTLQKGALGIQAQLSGRLKKYRDPFKGYVAQQAKQAVLYGDLVGHSHAVRGFNMRKKFNEDRYDTLTEEAEALQKRVTSFDGLADIYREIIAQYRILQTLALHYQQIIGHGAVLGADGETYFVSVVEMTPLPPAKLGPVAFPNKKKKPTPKKKKRSKYEALGSSSEESDGSDGAGGSDVAMKDRVKKESKHKKQKKDPKKG